MLKKQEKIWFHHIFGIDPTCTSYHGDLAQACFRQLCLCCFFKITCYDQVPLIQGLDYIHSHPWSVWTILCNEMLDKSDSDHVTMLSRSNQEIGASRCTLGGPISLIEPSMIMQIFFFTKSAIDEKKKSLFQILLYGV